MYRIVVRTARGQLPENNGETPNPSTSEKQDWKLFHETPLPNCLQSRSLLESPMPVGAEFQTPEAIRNKAATNVTEEFAMNNLKDQFKQWVKVIKKHGMSMNDLRTQLTQHLIFPTDLIYALKEEGSLNILAKVLTHSGFGARYRVFMPRIQFKEPRMCEDDVDVKFGTVAQQRDLRCRFCRGFIWSGKVETRQLNEQGSVPIHSHHKTVVPYTPEELVAFSNHKYDYLYRRWCQESRWDWIFETPDLNPEANWMVPNDDPRLRHVAMIRLKGKEPESQIKIYDADLEKHYNNTRIDLTKQDIAAALLIEAIREENPAIAIKYERVDNERKRTQVQVKFLCVRQVKVVPRKFEAAAQPRTENKKRKTADDCSVKKPIDDSGSPSQPSKRVKTVKKARAAALSKKQVTFARSHAGPTAPGDRQPAVKGILKVPQSDFTFLCGLPKEKNSGTNGNNPDQSEMPDDAPKYFYGAHTLDPQYRLPPSFDPVLIRKERGDITPKEDDEICTEWDTNLTMEQNLFNLRSYHYDKIIERDDKRRILMEQNLIKERLEEEKREAAAKLNNHTGKAEHLI